MKFSLYMDDSETEKFFSYIRWVVAVVVCLMFYFPPLSERLQFEHRTFPLLLGISIAYISLVQVALTRLSKWDRQFIVLTRCGILFDFIVIFWLLGLTGGVLSPLFPLSYLIIMHATIYWRTKGAILTSFGATICYVIVLLVSQTWTFDVLFVFFINLFFLWIVGIVGSMLVLRERLHLKEKEVFKELMITDYLTGLLNHRSFQEQLRLLASSKKPFALILGDIDYFKVVNDTYGHVAGDILLKEIGSVFQELAGEYKGMSFRYGGEEFAFLLSDPGHMDVEAFVTDIYTKLQEINFTENRLKITMSFAVSTSSRFASIDELVSHVDMLLYKSKTSGRNRAFIDTGGNEITIINQHDLP